jgi:hypothetical protein
LHKAHNHGVANVKFVTCLINTMKSIKAVILKHPLWSSGQSFWLQINRPGFDSRPYQIFLEAVGLERGPLNLVSTTEELLGRLSSGSGLESGILVTPLRA